MSRLLVMCVRPEGALVWHGALLPSVGATKGELLEARPTGLSPLLDAAARFDQRGLWSPNAARKQLQEARRAAGDPAHPVRYCGCGCGRALPATPVAAERKAGRFVTGHARLKARRRP